MRIIQFGVLNSGKRNSMTEKWSPFREAEHNLLDYDNFFDDQKTRSFFESPQSMEDWLYENCPNNFCYVWLHTRKWGWQKGPIILGQLIGVPYNVSLALKLITGIDPYNLDDYEVGYIMVSGKKIYRLEKKLN